MTTCLCAGFSRRNVVSLYRAYQQARPLIRSFENRKHAMASVEQPPLHQTYLYGALTPEGWSDIEQAAHHRMIDYWNTILAIRQAAERGHQNLIYPEGTPARQMLQCAKQKGHPEQREAAIALKALRAINQEERKSELALLRENEKATLKHIRQKSGLWWHHYLAVQQWFDRAEKLCRKNQVGLREKSADTTAPHFSLAFPRGLPVQKFMESKSSLLRLERDQKAPYKAHLHFASQEKQGEAHKTLRIPIAWHRELPASAVIKRVDLIQAKALRNAKWKVLFTIENPEFTPPKTATTSYCGVDLGWRMQEDGLRVAYWTTNQGESGEISLPANWLEKAKYLEKLRQKIQIESKRTAEYLQAMGVSSITNPEHPTRQLIQLYQETRGVPDKLLPPLIEWWSGNARHIREAEGIAKRLERQRAYIYQNACKSLVTQFDVIGTEKIGLVRLKALQKEDAPYIVRRSQQWAALNQLLHWLQFMCQKNGNKFMLVPSTNNTQRCAQCGHINRQSTLKKLVTCERCQSVWDQDSNASKNIVARMLEDDAKPVGALAKS